MPRLKYFCVNCGKEYTRSQLKKSYSEHWEKTKGYNDLVCPDCEHRGSFSISVYYSKKELDKMKM